MGIRQSGCRMFRQVRMTWPHCWSVASPGPGNLEWAVDQVNNMGGMMING